MGVVELVTRHEGWRTWVYCDKCGCTVVAAIPSNGTWHCWSVCKGGNLTIGYGINLGAGVTQGEGLFLLRSRLQSAVGDLERFAWFNALSDARQAALVDMRYTLGASRLRDFRDMIASLAAGDLHRAAGAMLESTWAREEAPARAAEDARMLESGEWE